MEMPTNTRRMPEIKFVIRTAYGEDNNDLTFATKKIIEIFPIIGMEKESSEIRQTSNRLISSKLKKLGSRVIQNSEALGFAVTAIKPA